MGTDFITGIHYLSSTESGYPSADHRHMPKQAPTSEFWERLMEIPEFAQCRTQTAVAKLVTAVSGEEYGQTAIHKWKAGHALPHLTTISSIAKRYGLCTEWLINGVGPREPHESKDADLARIIGLWKYMSPDARRNMVSHAILERTLQHTGDPRRRDEYQRSLKQTTAAARALEESIRKQMEKD